MANAFNLGDLVQLKSGGPPMTVDEVPGQATFLEPREDYKCVWFKGATRDQSAFAEHLLQPYVAPAKPAK